MSDPQTPDTPTAGGRSPGAQEAEREVPAGSRPDVAFPPSTPDAGPGVPFPAAADPYSALPPSPKVQYFQPPGPLLPPRAWRRNLRTWVWPVSVLAGVLMLVLAVGALVLGFSSQLYVTATGAVRADCSTGEAFGDSSVRAGSTVELYDARDGEFLARGHLRSSTAPREGQCRLPFTIDRVRSSDGYLVEIGAIPPQRVTRGELEDGVVIG